LFSLGDGKASGRLVHQLLKGSWRAKEAYSRRAFSRPLKSIFIDEKRSPPG